MASVFISYSTKDSLYAYRLKSYLERFGITTWFSPHRIEVGDYFVDAINEGLGGSGERRESEEMLKASEVLVLLLSKNAMESEWVKREVHAAINNGIKILALRIDRSPIDRSYQFLLMDQWEDAYHLPNESLERIKDKILENLSLESPQFVSSEKAFTYDELKIETIASGDPYFKYGETLKVRLTGQEFFLSAPKDLVEAENEEWVKNHFKPQDDVFGESLKEYVGKIPIEDLLERIEGARRKVFLQFLKGENGLYYNNEKFGVCGVNPFGRTEDAAEDPELKIELYLTDYFTHRVIKEVCKDLIKERNPYIEAASFTNIGVNKIFFTSLGINLLLLDDYTKNKRDALLTTRSKNASETYGSTLISTSVIEGVSRSDYDYYHKTVDLEYAAFRGIDEELGIPEYALRKDTLKFYTLFVNLRNFEIGLTCSVDLGRFLTLEKMRSKVGKDDMLEIGDKWIVPLDELVGFIHKYREDFLPQALYTIISYLQAKGEKLLDRHQHLLYGEESLVASKKGLDEECGDRIHQSDKFIAVIDGATPKGQRLWDGLPGDVFVSKLLDETISNLDADASGEEAVTALNDAIREAYEKNGVDIATLEPEEQLQASAILFSKSRNEIWVFGDCKLMINSTEYDHTKNVDKLMADLRAFYIELYKLKSGNPVLEKDVGREAILDLLKAQSLFANKDVSFGFPVLNGGEIDLGKIIKYKLRAGDHVVMASDGYPKLFESLEETETYLKRGLESDRECVGVLRGTKMVADGNASYDDRSYVSFYVK